jgi:hypothetical protein
MLFTVVRKPLAGGEIRVTADVAASTGHTFNTPESVGARLAFASPGYQ